MGVGEHRTVGVVRPRKGNVSRQGAECQAVHGTGRALCRTLLEIVMATRPPARPSARSSAARKRTPRRGTRLRLLLATPKKKWLRYSSCYGVAGTTLVVLLTGVYFWISYGRLIDSKLERRTAADAAHFRTAVRNPAGPGTGAGAVGATAERCRVCRAGETRTARRILGRRGIRAASRRGLPRRIASASSASSSRRAPRRSSRS